MSLNEYVDAQVRSLSDLLAMRRKRQRPAKPVILVHDCQATARHRALFGLESGEYVVLVEDKDADLTALAGLDVVCHNMALDGWDRKAFAKRLSECGARTVEILTAEQEAAFTDACTNTTVELGMLKAEGKLRG